MSFVPQNSDIPYTHQSQLIPLIRQLHQESLNNQVSYNSYFNSQRLYHNNFQGFCQNDFPKNYYQMGLLNNQPNLKGPNNSLCNSQNAFTFNFQNLQVKGINNGHQNWKETTVQFGEGSSEMVPQDKNKSQVNSENNDYQNNHMLFTPLGKSMPVRTFNFKLKPSKNKPFSKQFTTQKKNNKANPNKSREDSFALELETKLAKEGKFTLNLYHELKNSFSVLIKIQQISRICQLYLEKTSQSILHLIFSEIMSQLPELLFDPYGNYFCLKLFSFLDTKDRIMYLTKIAPSFAQLSTNKISTYPIQCIIEQLHSINEQKIIFTSLKPTEYIKLALDSYGTHVLAKIIILFNYSLIQPLSKFILDNFLFLANNSNGLCIIKKEILVEYKKHNFEQLKYELGHNSLVLVQSPYGNYALQIAIDNWDLKDIESIIFDFIGKCSVLSIQKYSSNVIEKSIEKSEKFAEEFVKEMKNTEGTFSLLMKNNYGNYVIQAALKVVSMVNKKIIIQLIEKNLSQLTDKKMINKWKNIISIYST